MEQHQAHDHHSRLWSLGMYTKGKWEDLSKNLKEKFVTKNSTKYDM